MNHIIIFLRITFGMNIKTDSYKKNVYSGDRFLILQKESVKNCITKEGKMKNNYFRLWYMLLLKI